MHFFSMGGPGPPCDPPGCWCCPLIHDAALLQYSASSSTARPQLLWVALRILWSGLTLTKVRPPSSKADSPYRPALPLELRPFRASKVCQNVILSVTCSWRRRKKNSRVKWVRYKKERTSARFEWAFYFFDVFSRIRFCVPKWRTSTTGSGVVTPSRSGCGWTTLNTTWIKGESNLTF